MVLCGITRCQFTIRLRIGAAATGEPRAYWTISLLVPNSYHAPRDFSGAPICPPRFGDCKRNEHSKPRSSPDVCLRRDAFAPALSRTCVRWTGCEDHL